MLWLESFGQATGGQRTGFHAHIVSQGSLVDCKRLEEIRRVKKVHHPTFQRSLRYLSAQKEAVLRHFQCKGHVLYIYPVEQNLPIKGIRRSRFSLRKLVQCKRKIRILYIKLVDTGRLRRKHHPMAFQKQLTQVSFHDHSLDEIARVDRCTL